MASPGNFTLESKTYGDTPCDEGSSPKVGTPDTSVTSLTGGGDVEDFEDASTRATGAPKSHLYVISAHDENTGKQYLK